MNAEQIYTPEELDKFRETMRGALEAEQHFTLDELEAHADAIRNETP